MNIQDFCLFCLKKLLKKNKSLFLHNDGTNTNVGVETICTDQSSLDIIR